MIVRDFVVLTFVSLFVILNDIKLVLFLIVLVVLGGCSNHRVESIGIVANSTVCISGTSDSLDVDSIIIEVLRDSGYNFSSGYECSYKLLYTFRAWDHIDLDFVYGRVDLYAEGVSVGSGTIGYKDFYFGILYEDRIKDMRGRIEPLVLGVLGEGNM